MDDERRAAIVSYLNRLYNSYPDAVLLQRMADYSHSHGIPVDEWMRSLLPPRP